MPNRRLAVTVLGTAVLILAAAGPAAAAGTAHFKDDNGIQYTVTPLGIIHPARPATEFDAPASGSILVAVEFRVKNVSARHPVSDDADADVTVVASNDQTGCVVFELRKGLRVTEVKWSAGFGFGGQAEWHVSP